MNKIKLFAFPYAGGNSNVFRPWKFKLDSFIQLEPVELAGRGSRMYEPLCDSIADVIEDIKNRITENSSNYALFGHSMGTIIIYELLRMIQKEGFNLPCHVIFSGRQAPHIKNNNEKQFHLMGSDQFKNEIIKLGGTPEEIFNDPELAELFLPVLRNDFKVCETYKFNRMDQRVQTDFTVIAGKDEGYKESDLSAYSEYTSGMTTVQYFNGGHFFIKESETEIIDLINNTLRRYT